MLRFSICIDVRRERALCNTRLSGRASSRQPPTRLQSHRSRRHPHVPTRRQRAWPMKIDRSGPAQQTRRRRTIGCGAATVTDSKFFFDILPKLGASRPERAFGRSDSGFSRRAGRFSGGFPAFEGGFGALIARYGKISKNSSGFITVFAPCKLGTTLATAEPPSTPSPSRTATGTSTDPSAREASGTAVGAIRPRSTSNAVAASTDAPSSWGRRRSRARSAMRPRTSIAPSSMSSSCRKTADRGKRRDPTSSGPVGACRRQAREASTRRSRRPRGWRSRPRRRRWRGP